VTQVFYHYSQCEEFFPDNGMWRTVSGAAARQKHSDDAAALMRDREAFTAAMRRVLVEWPKSTEVNLTNPAVNHRAFMGHAGCFLATGSPEDCTRLGWHALTDAEQRIANAAATQVIAEWTASYEERLAPLELFNA
jgi:hypothetical protein